MVMNQHELAELGEQGRVFCVHEKGDSQLEEGTAVKCSGEGVMRMRRQKLLSACLGDARRLDLL